jgi:hypothetical protein
VPVAFQVPSSKAKPSQSAAILSSAFSIPNSRLALRSEYPHSERDFGKLAQHLTVELYVVARVKCRLRMATW